jgi:hypothetical protein
MTINVLGKYNNVDTVAQGFARIAPASKPTTQVTLGSIAPTPSMTFGALYDLAKEADFTADNVGITPLLLQASTSGLTSATFTVKISATALASDSP